MEKFPGRSFFRNKFIGSIKSEKTPNKKKNLFRFIAGILGAAVILLAGTSYAGKAVPEYLYLPKGEKTNLDNLSSSIPVSASYDGISSATWKMFGFLPFKKTQATEIERPELIPGGAPFGIKILTDGVVVTGLTELKGVSPAEDAGIKTGDILISVNGKKVLTNKEVSQAVQLNSDETEIILKRGEKELKFTAVPVVDGGLLKIGIWVRDSSAGIGTLTFYDKKTGIFAGLGHGICDADTGEIMPLLKGEAVRVSIGSIIKSSGGVPGELCGSFLSSDALGSLKQNTECGVFGKISETENNSASSELNTVFSGNSIPLAFKQEIQLGKASIFSTIEGEIPQEYDVEIEKINYDEDAKVKNMVIRVTDPKLLAKTGGIVQGMSGSPLIQDGKLAGAVTHVFIGDTERGYAIFAENMYRQSINRQ